LRGKMSSNTNSLTSKGIDAINIPVPFQSLMIRNPTLIALTKNDIVERLQAELCFTKSQSIQVTECLIEVIKASLESGDDVLVSGFGKFCVKEKMGRRGRNPATGEDMTLEPRRVVTFKYSGSLRKRVIGGVYFAQSERRLCCLNILKKDNVMSS